MSPFTFLIASLSLLTCSMVETNGGQRSRTKVDAHRQNLGGNNPDDSVIEEDIHGSYVGERVRKGAVEAKEAPEWFTDTISESDDSGRREKVRYGEVRGELEGLGSANEDFPERGDDEVQQDVQDLVEDETIPVWSTITTDHGDSSKGNRRHELERYGEVKSELEPLRSANDQFPIVDDDNKHVSQNAVEVSTTVSVLSAENTGQSGKSRRRGRREKVEYRELEDLESSSKDSREEGDFRELKVLQDSVEVKTVAVSSTDLSDNGREKRPRKVDYREDSSRIGGFLSVDEGLVGGDIVDKEQFVQGTAEGKLVPADGSDATNQSDDVREKGVREKVRYADVRSEFEDLESAGVESTTGGGGEEQVSQRTEEVERIPVASTDKADRSDKSGGKSKRRKVDYGEDLNIVGGVESVNEGDEQVDRDGLDVYTSPVGSVWNATPTVTALNDLKVSEDDEDVESVTQEEEYDYDLEESLNTFNWTELLPALVVYSLTFVFGVTGNFLIIVATTSCRRRSGFRSSCCCLPAASSSYMSSHGRGLQTPSPTNVFLASLASADLLLILICIPVKMAKLFSYTWTMGVFLCKFVYYMQNVSTICSVLTLTAISLERYYAIVHPMKAKYTCTVGQATKIVLAIWVASLLLAVPILFVQVHMSVGVKIRAYWCFRDLDNVELWRFHEVYLLLLILILPTCVMASAYASICGEIWKVMRRRYHMTGGMKGINPPVSGPLGCNGASPDSTSMVTSESFRMSSKKINSANSSRRFRAPRMQVNSEESDTESGTVKKVIKMLVTVVVLFVICWAPVLIDNVMTAYQVLPVLRDSNSSWRHMGNAFHLMSYFNSCINPIVYGFMSKSFRASFIRVLCRCCWTGGGRATALEGGRRTLSTTSRTRTTSFRYADSRSMGPQFSPGMENNCEANNHARQDMFD
ncbi:uncharacterized protein LOC124167202 [Ischnura elegans]|uniref:uncharacterized protein LOC124167202 n=1 Tax=Ischnura elegans TaxID=197161 RepID=UPI001ED8B8B1|nr:uncharacterized protein LOC124167202 [Ischnura elegans]